MLVGADIRRSWGGTANPFYWRVLIYGVVVGRVLLCVGEQYCGCGVICV
jgi:hypothetical protein